MSTLAGAVGVAARVGNPAPASSAQSAYIEGMQLILMVCAAITVVGAVLTVILRPGRTALPVTRIDWPNSSASCLFIA
ncbi:hypothetical protein ACLQ28_18060 [Micromonospora sp. DT201]|uniref:hypothetical protein n=1 Tax=Micromonospora sp. DT201 TaxID=3393442 RepID=UPI003CE907B4